MAPTSPFICFEEKLMQVVEETSKTLSSCLEIYMFTIYLKMKTDSDIVEKVGDKYDDPPLDEKDRCGSESRKRKEKNKLYTWIKNSLKRKSCGLMESFKEKWTRYADANPLMVVQYIRSRPRIQAQLQSDLDTEEQNTRVENSGLGAEEGFERGQESMTIKGTIETPRCYPKRKRKPKVLFTPDDASTSSLLLKHSGTRKRKAPVLFSPSDFK